SPPTGGTYKGVTLFQARSAGGEIAVTGGGTLNLIGAAYAAGGELAITGNGQVKGGGDPVHHIGSQFIGFDLAVAGNGQLTLDARDFSALTLTANLSPAPQTLPDGTAVTNVRNSFITGITNPQATIDLESGGDLLFDDGSTIADASGNYS